MPRRVTAVLGLATAAYALVTSIALATVDIARNGWFGSRDLFPFAIYSVPFAAAAWPLSRLLSFVTGRWPLWLTLFAAFVLGLLHGYAATYALALLLGPWIGAL